jgi:hypothetical protein
MTTVADFVKEFDILHNLYLENVKPQCSDLDFEDRKERCFVYRDYLESSPTAQDAAYRFLAFCRPGHTRTNKLGEVLTFNKRGSGFNVVYGGGAENVLEFFKNFCLPSTDEERKNLLTKSLSLKKYYNPLILPREPVDEFVTPEPTPQKTPQAPKPGSMPVKIKVVKGLPKSFASIIAPEDEAPAAESKPLWRPKAAAIASPSIIKVAKKPTKQPTVEEPPAIIEQPADQAIVPVPMSAFDIEHNITLTRTFIASKRFPAKVSDQFEALAKVFGLLKATMNGLERIFDKQLVHRLANPLCDSIDILGTKGVVPICNWILANEEDQSDIHSLVCVSIALSNKLIKISPLAPVPTLKAIQGENTNLLDSIFATRALLLKLKARDDCAAIASSTPQSIIDEFYAVIAITRELFPRQD